MRLKLQWSQLNLLHDGLWFYWSIKFHLGIIANLVINIIFDPLLVKSPINTI